MPITLTDLEIKQAMKALATLAGLDLSDERIERDLAQYKAHLRAIEAIRAVDLPLEAEPLPLIVLPRT